jgi:amidase
MERQALQEITSGGILPASSLDGVAREIGIWIEEYTAESGTTTGPSVAVKDLIDTVGTITTAGCRALADTAEPASSDAFCVSSIRAAGGQIVGKTNLHELAFGISGVNREFGTPPNPLEPGRIPGGSSSGSAVAVALHMADVGIGSDTGGSIRIPAACCGVVGLKTTYGLIPLDGVRPLAPSYDTIGPLATSVAGVVMGMRLLLGSFLPEGLGVATSSIARTVGRLQLGLSSGVHIDPEIERSVDTALSDAEIDSVAVAIEGWNHAYRNHQILLGAEALEANASLLAKSGGAGISEETLARFRASQTSLGDRAEARSNGERFSTELRELVVAHGALVLPTLPCRPPVIGEPLRGFNALVAPVNLAGLPAVSVPIPMLLPKDRGAGGGSPPLGRHRVTALQIIGPPGGEERLVALAARIERAVSDGMGQGASW